jgi:Ca-activated chloride channel homolog
MKPSRRTLRLLVVAAVCAALLASAASAQEKKEEKPEPPLRVKVSALVFDSQDRLVGDLRREDFQILEDGAAQQISVFERQEGPHAFGLVVDSSGSLRGEINQVIAFAQMIVAGTGADSEGFVIRFTGSDNIKMIQDVTADKAALARALDGIYVEAGQTAINDAVYLAADRLAKYRQTQKSPRRYSLVLVTDGEDRASFYTSEQVFAKLRDSGLRLFVVGLVNGPYTRTPEQRAKDYMNRLAFESGGSAYFVRKGSELQPVARQILAEMSANYLLGYDSTNTKRDGSTRKLQLTVSNGAGGEPRKVLAKDSYVAPKKKQL